MVLRIKRSLLCQFTYCANNYFKAAHFSSKTLNPAPSFSRRGVDQVEYIRTVLESNKLDWPNIRRNVISKQGHINEKNFDGVLLKMLISQQKLDIALSYANHLKDSSEELTLGATNGLLSLYYEIGNTRELSKEDKHFILDIYKALYKKYKVLDFTTCERLIPALCVIDEWEKALRVLEDIYNSAVPSHKAYSILIATLFKNNKKKKSLELINKSIEDKRPLQNIAFEEWINYILRKYKDKKIILKYLDEIYVHISKTYAVVDEKTAIKLKDTFKSLDWDAGLCRIKKSSGECSHCRDTLDHSQLSQEEFLLLQQNVKNNLIVGSDLFLKTSPEELKRFLKFVEKTAPYDVVIDALNVAYAVVKNSSINRLATLFAVVDYFKDMNKKILVLGRQHMLKWGRGSIGKLNSSTYSFFTDDLSQDDPYFITAAILSGPHTDIVSKDLLRGHQFLLKDKQLDYIFRRWQWQHQWMAIHRPHTGLKIQAPLVFTPCAQKKNGAWHLPYEREDNQEMKLKFNDGTPDLSSWLCIRPNQMNVNKNIS